MKVEIGAGTISEVVKISNALPEFTNPHGQEEYFRRFEDVRHCIWTASINDQTVGFKVGYDRMLNGQIFYSWMGGVLPNFRKQGIAQLLQRAMELWCIDQGYNSLHCKTRNRHRAMIHFLLKNRFYLVSLTPYDDPMENRLLFEKKLLAIEKVG